MRIVINHLTRMTEGHVCVAGVDLQTGRHVRPVLARGQIAPAMLVPYGGPFELAHLVNLEGAVPRPKPPHVEDCLFDPAQTRRVEPMEADTFWALLTRISRTTLADIFGAALRPARNSTGCCTDQGQGNASLGCLVPRRRPLLRWEPAGPKNPKPRIRISVDDGQRTVWASVTDLRLYRTDYETPDLDRIEAMRRRLERPGAVILAVGLTRGYASSCEPQPVHWLQVNNIHLEAGF